MDADTTAPAAARTVTVPKAQLVTGMSVRTQRIVALAGVIVLLILAFYGGRAYQNSIDQKLFNAYNPPSTGARGTGFGGTGTGSTTGSGSLVNTALGVGSPPGTSSSGAPSGSSSSGNFGFGGSGTGSTGNAANRISGTLASISAGSLSVTSVSGLSQSVALNSATRFYRTETVSYSTLKPGTRVSVLATGSGSQLSAASISIGAVSATTGGRRFGGGAGGFATTSTPVTTLSGKISRASATSITLSGRSSVIALTSTTRITTAVAIKPNQLTSGSFVTVSVRTVGGSQVATSVVSRAGGLGGGFGASQPGG